MDTTFLPTLSASVVSLRANLLAVRKGEKIGPNKPLKQQVAIFCGLSPFGAQKEIKKKKQKAKTRLGLALAFASWTLSTRVEAGFGNGMHKVE